MHFVENIKHRAEEEAKQCSDWQRPNPYYIPEFVNHLQKLANFFPIFTNVMKDKFSPKYDVGSSAIVEAYFKDPSR